MSEKVLQQESLISEINKVLADALDVEMNGLHPATRLIDDLKMDSLMGVELMLTLEEKFGIDVNVDEIRTMISMEDVYRFVDTKARKVKADVLAAGCDSHVAK